MADKKELYQLMALRKKNLPKWIVGKIPSHYKRLSVDTEEADRLARLGQTELWAAFGVKLYYTQAMIAGAMLSGDYDDFAMCTSSQYGKAMADDTPVLTKDGWKNHGDLKVGDYVIGLDGEFVKVLAVHPKCEMDRRVTLQNGDSFICHHNHEWVYTYSCRGKKEVRAVSVSEMEMRGLTQGKNNATKFRIPRHKIVKGEKKDLKVPPYVMGVWLGDGSTTKGQICSCKKDIAVLDRCREYYPNGSEWVHKTTGVITRSFIGLANDLTEYNMCFQRKDTPRKHIPEEYLTASVEQRLELLAGLIDTDGSCFADDRYDGATRLFFTTADEPLKDSFEELLGTFGWRASVAQIEPRLSSSGIQGKHRYWLISFTPSCDVPCVLERKRVVKVGRFNRGIGITNIEKVSGIQGNCITVEGGIYLVGKHLIPTHNSWLLSRISIVKAYRGDTVYIAGGRKDTTEVIMRHLLNALQTAAPEIQKALTETDSQIKRLAKSLSKTRISFHNGGSVESVSLGDTYTGLSGNSAIGRGGDYIVDEAALISGDTLAELGRVDFAKLNGEKCQLAMISNPHNPGMFYDMLTEPQDERTFVLWADALTAVEEERFTEESVLNGKFTKNKSTMRRYLLCELDVQGESMFDTPKIDNEIHEGTYFLGVDAAYKGKDNICLALVKLTEEGRFHCEEIEILDKSNWIDGVTNNAIIREVARVAKRAMCPLVCVDQGYGVWLIQGLTGLGVNALGIAFQGSPTPARKKARHYAATNAQNMRAEMHLDLQNLIDDGFFDITEGAYEKIRDILPYVIADRKSSGVIQVRPKIDIKKSIGRSPDELDALLLAVHAAVVFAGESLSFVYEQEA